jgi:hypothetical protein
MIGYGYSYFVSTILDTESGTPPVNTVAPAISGTAQEGQTVTCSTGTWTGTPTITYAYQWKRNGSNIGSATNSTYLLVSADVGQSITCQVTATNGAGSASANSNTITPIAAVDPDAQAFITAASITDPTQQSAINQLVVDLKGYSIWTKMKALYPFVGGSASSHKWNLKNPLDTDAAFRLVFNGGWTHSSTGALPNGTNAYADTKLNPSSSLNLDSTHFSFYSRTNSNGTEVEMGVQHTNSSLNLLEIRTSGTTYIAVNSQGTYTTYADTDSRAFYIANRTASNVVNSWRNSTKKATGTTASSSLPNGNMWLSAWNNIANPALLYYSTKQTAFASIGDGLTDAEAANFYTAVQAFNTTLGRQV